MGYLYLFDRDLKKFNDAGHTVFRELIKKNPNAKVKKILIKFKSY